MSKSSGNKSATKRKRPPLGTLEELAVFAIDGQLAYMSMISSFMLDKRVPTKLKGMRDQNPRLKAAEPNSDKAKLAAEVRKLIKPVRRLIKNGEMEVAHVATVMELAKSFEALYLHVFGAVEAMKRGVLENEHLAKGPIARKKQAKLRRDDREMVMKAIMNGGEHLNKLIKEIESESRARHLKEAEKTKLVKDLRGYRLSKDGKMKAHSLCAEIQNCSVSSTYSRKEKRRHPM